MARKYEDADRAILGRAPDAMRCVVQGFRPCLRRYRYPHPEVADMLMTGAPILGEFAAVGVWSRDPREGSPDPGLDASERIRSGFATIPAQRSGRAISRAAVLRAKLI